MTETALKPCPFCGSRAQIERGKIECSNPFCGASVEFSFPGKERNVWNNRTPAEQLEAENKRLRELLKSSCNEFVQRGRIFRVPCNRCGTVDIDRHCTDRNDCPVYLELTKGARND